ncbi:hypothetical protein B0H17DRAFT_1278784 [Mycena rosella]|uniref:Uncharacterized protein n=1 Tax=Mycena rosella TaxID=1033263 RepID=A0AAD7C2X8_MYCRO|nr:hypothetical protein B0H17DRAFT_1278784 [Mycena rosella]
MFDHCSNITITDGTFNVLERSPSDFRSIRLGDLNLLTQMGNEEELTSGVVERRGPRLVRRKVIVGSRKVYCARIFGSPDPMTAVVYEGSQFEKWKDEAERRQSVRLPFVLQLFGVTESRDVNVLIYHDELITITQFRQLHPSGSPLTSEYIEYQMARDDALFSPMDVCDIHAMLVAFPSWRHVKLSVHDHIPLGKLATVGGDLLDFHTHFLDSKLSKFELHVGPWRAYGAPIVTDITALDTQWTRIAVPAGSEDDLRFYSYSSIPDTPYMRKSWIFRAPRLLDSGIATGVKLNDLLAIDKVYLWMRLHYPAQNTDPPSKLPYLFVFSPAAHFEQDGTVWIEIQPPDQRYYWSFDPLGGDQFREDLAASSPFPK